MYSEVGQWPYQVSFWIVRCIQRPHTPTILLDCWLYQCTSVFRGHVHQLYFWIAGFYQCIQRPAIPRILFDCRSLPMYLFRGQPYQIYFWIASMLARKSNWSTHFSFVNCGLHTRKNVNVRYVVFRQ